MEFSYEECLRICRELERETSDLVNILLSVVAGAVIGIGICKIGRDIEYNLYHVNEIHKLQPKIPEFVIYDSNR